MVQTCGFFALMVPFRCFQTLEKPPDGQSGSGVADYFPPPASVKWTASAVGGEMKFSAAGMELLKRSEGFRNRVYLDAAGFPTVGYGHRLVHPESFLNGISELQAAQLLAGDVVEAEQTVQRLVKVALTQGQFDALVDFCFNLGEGRLAGSSLLQDLNARRYDEARDQLLRWDHAGARECAALKARREAEAGLWGDDRAGRQAAA